MQSASLQLNRNNYSKAFSLTTLFFGLLPLKFYIENELESADEVAKQKEMIGYLTKCAGMTITNSADVFYLYCILSTQDKCGLKLPEWTKKVYPEPLTTIAANFYRFLLTDDDAKRLATGAMLRKIIKDTAIVLSKEHKNRKMHLYSGHEVNLAFLLITLGLFKPHVPPYLAHVIIEVHTINGVDGLKIFYQDYSSDKPQILKLADCDEFCPLDKFIATFEEYMKE